MSGKISMIINYTKLTYQMTSSYQRYKRRVEAMPRKLYCQECRGSGEHFEDRIAEHDLMSSCGWCQGTGLLTPWMRGQWLKEKRNDKLR